MTPADRPPAEGPERPFAPPTSNPPDPAAWAPADPPAPAAPAAPAATGADAWPAWNAPVGLVLGLIGAFVGGLVVVIIATALGADATGDDTPPGVLLGATLVQDIALIAAAVILARASGPVTAAMFGFRSTRLWRGVGAVFALYIAFVLFASVWQQLVGGPDEEPLLDDLGVDESTLLLVLGILTVCVAAPLVEEVFFRGFFYRALRNWAGVAGAAILTGLIFGAMHATSSPVEHLVPLAVLGALFCLLYQFTGSLYPCIAAHAINNSIAFGDSEDWGGGETALLVLGSLAACALVCLVVTARDRGRSTA